MTSEVGVQLLSTRHSYCFKPAEQTAHKIKLQGLDPESGLWILCKKLEGKHGRTTV